MPFEVWTGISLIYIAIVFLIDALVRLLERRLRPGARINGLLAGRRNAAIAGIVAGAQAHPAPPDRGLDRSNNTMTQQHMKETP